MRRKPVKDRVVSFPQLGDYGIPLKSIAGLFGETVILPPRMTTRTLEIGAKHSPEFVCVPFKYTLGNYIESLELGADTLIQAGGGCRLSYYGEVQEAILNDLGYDFEFIALSSQSTSVARLVREFKRLNPRNSVKHILGAIDLAWKKAEALEEVQELVRRNIAFQTVPGTMEDIERSFLRALDDSPDAETTAEVSAEFARRVREVAVDRPDRPLRVGVVGEVYLVLEPFANHFVERRLAEHGVEVHRHVSLVSVMENVYDPANHLHDLLAKADPYIRHDIGIDGTKSVAVANELMKQGFDGLVHVKPFGCMPEVNAVAPLQRLSREHLFPILFLSFDTQSSTTGVRTRIEAFCDMIARRREARRSV